MFASFLSAAIVRRTARTVRPVKFGGRNAARDRHAWDAGFDLVLHIEQRLTRANDLARQRLLEGRRIGGV